MNEGLRSERGIALPVVAGALLVGALLCAVATGSASSALRQSLGDRQAKRSIAAADAGAEVAAYRLNKFAHAIDTVSHCVSVSVAGTLVVESLLGDGWCRRQSEDLGDGASFSYRVSEAVRVRVDDQDIYQRRVVSTGTVGGVQRKVMATLSAPTGKALFADTVFSREDLPMRNSSVVVGNVRSNGNIVTQNSATICGTATVGPGKEFRGDGLCPGYSSQQASEEWVLSAVDIPAVNDNLRIGVTDPWTDPGFIDWSLVTRVLKLRNSATLTLNGGNYVFCGLELSQSSRLIVPDDGTPVRIFIDSPERCGGRSLSFGLYNSSTIQNDSGDPTMSQMYVAGSPSVSTQVELRNLTQLSMTVYAPNSVVTFDNYSHLLGAVASKRVVMNNNLEIRWDPRVAGLLVGDVPLPIYQRKTWFECRALATGGAPDAGC